MWSTFVADHALTSAIVDRPRGLRADLTRSAFHLENAAASSFQQGCVLSFIPSRIPQRIVVHSFSTDSSRVTVENHALSRATCRTALPYDGYVYSKVADSELNFQKAVLLREDESVVQM
jgi:hypothetical protein